MKFVLSLFLLFFLVGCNQESFVTGEFSFKNIEGQGDFTIKKVQGKNKYNVEYSAISNTEIPHTCSGEWDGVSVKNKQLLLKTPTGKEGEFCTIEVKEVSDTIQVSSNTLCNFLICGMNAQVFNETYLPVQEK